MALKELTDELAYRSRRRRSGPPSSRRNALLCALVTAACILLVHPFADIPFGDDFSYTRTALDFLRTGHLIYNGWAQPIQGWWAVWGALFIKLFGFSFNAVRLSTLPVAMGSVYLFHQILVRFGVCAWDAVLGGLTLGLSPIFLMCATTYLTDVPGVLVILLCLYMCQRAVVATDDRAALLWLVFAGIVNVIAGTVRQTCWFGVLVMVPSTAWLLRERRGILAAGATTALAGAAAVVMCLRWANRQPFFFPEPLSISPRIIHPLPLAGEYLKGLLSLLLLLVPLAAGCLPFVGRLKPAAFLRVGVLLCAVPAFAAIHGGHGAIDQWRAPWLRPFLQILIADISPRVSLLLSVMLSVLAPGVGLIFLELVLAGRRKQAVGRRAACPALRTALWLVGPFTVVYLCALISGAAAGGLQDRYLLAILPFAILVLLLLYECWIAPRVAAVSIVVLCVITVYTMAATYDLYADLRATHAAVQELLANGVPRTAVTETFGADMWEQLEVAGHINNSKMVSASKYYRPDVPQWPFPEQCVRSAPQGFIPVIRPEYSIGPAPDQCAAPTQYAPVPYRAWLPPFHRSREIERPRHILP